SIALTARRLFFPHSPPSAIYTLSLHDALPIWRPEDQAHRDHRLRRTRPARRRPTSSPPASTRTGRHPQLHARGRRTGHDELVWRSEEHTSELQSRFDLVCRLLLEKKKTNTI